MLIMGLNLVSEGNFMQVDILPSENQALVTYLCYYTSASLVRMSFNKKTSQTYVIYIAGFYPIKECFDLYGFYNNFIIKFYSYFRAKYYLLCY